MYSREQHTGADLPLKYICLTYDDGPGKNTYDIATFLHDQNIRATFFVVGKYAFHHQDILEKTAMLGHLIANHTYDHPDMPFYLSINGDLHNQILQTDAVIKKHIRGDTVYFRSPYGKWSDEVADELNLNMLSTINHVGPVYWDVAGTDCYYWKTGRSVEHAVDNYINEITTKGRGIIVMHDDIADMDYLKEKNNTLELTKQLIPVLKSQGYQFVCLNEIPSVKNEASKTLKFTLKCANGKYVSLSENDGVTVDVDGRPNSKFNEVSVVELGYRKIALKASNGLFFTSLNKNGNFITATGSEIKESQTFDLIPLSANQITLRDYNGMYLNRENKSGGRLLASAAYMRGCERFEFSPLSVSFKKKISIPERYYSLKRQLLYIKSKVEQGSRPL